MLKLPDTGQTTSYTTTWGEDSDYTINPPSYTKMDASGNDLPDGATEWVMVRDNVTGLIWQKEDDDIIRDWDDANTYCIDLALAGYTDWRLPSKKELMSIVDYNTYSPSIDTTYFPGTNADTYWASTTYPNDSSVAWSVSFHYGNVWANSKSTTGYYVRCVRAGL